MKWCKWLAVILVVYVNAQPAFSYDCWSPQHRYYQLQDADVVFAGKVTAIKEIGRSPEELGTTRHQITATVYEVWKGLTQQDSSVIMDVESFYDYSFEKGAYYFFFGYKMYPERITLVGCPRIQELNESLYREMLNYQSVRYAINVLPEDIVGTMPQLSGQMRFEQEAAVSAEQEPPLEEGARAIVKRPGAIAPDMMDSTKGQVTPEEQDMLEAFQEKANEIRNNLPDVIEPITPDMAEPLSTQPLAEEGLTLPQAQILNGQLDKLLSGNGKTPKSPPSPQAKQVERAVQQELPQTETLPALPTMPELDELPALPPAP